MSNQKLDPADLHKAIMDRVWSLYCQSSVDANWLIMPEHIEKIHDEIDGLVAKALNLKELHDR